MSMTLLAGKYYFPLGESCILLLIVVEHIMLYDNEKQNEHIFNSLLYTPVTVLLIGWICGLISDVNALNKKKALEESQMLSNQKDIHSSSCRENEKMSWAFLCRIYTRLVAEKEKGRRSCCPILRMG